MAEWLFALTLLISLVFILASFMLKQSFFGRMVMILLFVITMGLVFLSYEELRSRPKPVNIEIFYRDVDVVEVFSAKVDYKNEKVYLLLKFPDIDEPRYYTFPYDQAFVQLLSDALRKGKATKGRVMMKNPFTGSDSTGEEQVFYAAPQKRQPNKILVKPPLEYKQDNLDLGN